MTDCDSSDEDPILLKKALDVDLPHDFNPNSIPQTGEEYLHHVIYERNNCKKCVTAKGDFTKYEKNQTVQISNDKAIERAPDRFHPTPDWQEKVITDFSQLRIFLDNTETPEPVKSSLNPEHFLEVVEKSPPKFSEVSKYSQAAKVIMLQTINKHLNHFDVNNGLSENLGAWIYAILALLEIPLSPDSCFNIREFAKKCANIRAKLSDDVKENVFVPLNLYICLVAKYFNQLDLAVYL